MASQQNRFAQLSPDFAAEDARRKKAAAAIEEKKRAEKKKEEDEREKAKQQEKAERQTESGLSAGAPAFRRGPRGPRGPRGSRGGRGGDRPYRGDRGRGGFSRGAPIGGATQEEAGPRAGGEYRFPGSGDPLHPYDRKSGTGRGTEISKRGGGARNWGRPEDALKHEELIDDVVEEETAGDKGPLSQEEPRREGRYQRKRYYRERPQERFVEEELAPYGTAVSYKEYQAIMAEKQATGPAPPASVPEGEPKPAEAEGKDSGTCLRDSVGANPPYEGGRGRRGGRRGGRYRGDDNRGPRGPRRDFEERGDNWGADSRPKERSYHPRADPADQPEAPKEEPKKPEPKPFVMREEDFPELK